MKILGKKIDILHQILIGALVIVLAMIILGFFTPNKGLSIQRLKREKALAHADFELMSGHFDEAELEYTDLLKLYPNSDSLLARMIMVKEKREFYKTYMSLQKELNHNIDAIENLESYMLIIENRNKNLVKNQSIQDTLLVVSDTTSNIMYSASKNPVVNTHVKDILDIINYDGTEIKYIGETENGKADGYGYAVFSKKGFYEGFWSDNRRNGKGIYYWQNGDTYEGAYKDGKREGFGTYTFASGEIYVGHWKNNLREGEGELRNKKGKLVFTGEWQDDEPMSAAKHKKKSH
jgi:hypothetical protein